MLLSIKEENIEKKPNETIKAHFTSLEDTVYTVQSVWRLPHADAYMFLHLKITN